MNKNKQQEDREKFLSISHSILENNNLLVDAGGISMYPILRAGDKLIIEKIDAKKLSLGDIIACNIHNRFIVHRLVSIQKQEPEFEFKSQGDNCRKADPIIHSNNIIGRVSGFVRKNKEYSLLERRFKFIRFLIIYFGFVTRPLISCSFKICDVMKKGMQFIQISKQNFYLIMHQDKRLAFWNICSAIGQGILPFAIIYLLKWFIDVLTITGSNTRANTLEWLLIGTALAFALQLITNTWGNYLREKFSQVINLHIQQLIHKKHSQLKFEQLDNPELKNLIHRANVEAGFRPNKMMHAGLTCIRSTVASLVMLGLMISIHPLIIVVLLIGLLPELYIRYYYTQKRYDLHLINNTQEREAYYYSRILTDFAFAKELRLFGTSGLFSKWFVGTQDKINNDKNMLSKKQVRAEVISQTASILIIFFLLAYITSLAVQGKETVGNVVLFVLVFQRGFVVIKDLLQSISTVYENNKFFADFNTFMALPIVEENKGETIKMETEIRFEQVSFQYPSTHKMALKNINLSIPKGKTLALVGSNGCGKTSLVKMLCGFHLPTQGKVFFDNTLLTESNQTAIRKNITAVFQDFALYNLSAAENIWLGDTSQDMDIERIKKACALAGIDKHIERLPLSYENRIGNLFEKGEELSVGQWQKIAIARAFYRDSEIILMDEPSSALDAFTEKQIMEGLKVLGKDKTVVIVSHRLAGIQWADKIIVMDNGEIIETGNHASLMQLQGKYYELYTLQNESKS